MSKQIKKILVANRGEIALRVQKTAHRMGIETVAIFAENDRELSFVREATEAFTLGEGSLRDTYLNIEKILHCARKSGADAIHPGYGMLSENHFFAKSVEDAGLIFIGPSSEHVQQMGDKKEAKGVAEQINIPLVPGYHGAAQGLEKLTTEAQKIGFPLLIKASAGGGGKGMRIVRDPQNFADELRLARSEAQKAFGQDQVLLERYIENPRHVEVQVLGDGRGGAWHFYERDCSIQRRYQKIVEEAPAPHLKTTIREKLWADACNLVKTLKYRGVGTVEFMVCGEEYYFLEMNTRLQVEHGVSEMITGHDLVAWQIKVARGEEVALKQEEIPLLGHGVEVRVYAEDPDNHFLPATGRLQEQSLYPQENTRIEQTYHHGSTITSSYDPMIAKLLAWGHTREQAIKKLQVLLEVKPFLGVKSNRDYLLRILKNKRFIAGEVHTGFIVQEEEGLRPRELSPREKAQAIAHLLLKVRGKASSTKLSDESNLWSELEGWRCV